MEGKPDREVHPLGRATLLLGRGTPARERACADEEASSPAAAAPNSRAATLDAVKIRVVFEAKKFEEIEKKRPRMHRGLCCSVGGSRGCVR